MFVPSYNTHIPPTHENFPGDSLHYTHYLFQDQQTRQPTETRLHNQQLPQFTETFYVPQPIISHPYTSRVHFEIEPSVGLEPLSMINRTSRIETSQPSDPLWTETNLIREANSRLSGAFPQSREEVT